MAFETIDYLKSGNPKQVRAYHVLTQHYILSKLNTYDPLLTGTIPINIDIETSDLDIICSFSEKEEFTTKLKELFSKQSNFKIWENKYHQAIVAHFTIDEFEIEVFGQNKPTREQLAYRHMLIEHEILQVKNESFRQQIIALKKQGYKTEVAFGLLLGLTENPYEQLLTYTAHQKKN